MEIKSKREGEVLTVWLEGDVCPGCVPQTEAFFNGNVDGVKKLVVDFGGGKKLAKEGLMLLLSTKKKLAGAEMSLVNVGEELYDKLDEQGITTLINISKPKQS